MATRAANPTPDVIVVGAGLTGSEAALYCARSGLSTLLITTSLDTSYNLARDVERLEPPAGTAMARLVPGLARVDGTVGNFALHRAVKLALESEPLLHTLQSTVSGLIVEDGEVRGVTTWEGVERRGGLTALCVGSFLRARLALGAVVEQQGRLSEMAYDDLGHDLESHGIELVEQRFELPAQAGTPAYTVTTKVVAAAELEEMRLRRLAGLFAAGACVEGASGSPPSYEEAALLGTMLGRALVAAAT